MTDAAGPIYAAGFQHVNSAGYGLLFLPDVHNAELQREGKPPVYYWLPNEVRLAQKANGDYKFSFLHFVGVRSETTTVASGDEEVSGGLIGFSTTTAPPAGVLEQAQNELLDRFRGNDDHYWGWRTPVAPAFRPAPIMSNTTTVTNLSPNPDGTVPAPPREGVPGAAAGLRAGEMQRGGLSRRPGPDRGVIHPGVAPLVVARSAPAMRNFPPVPPRTRGGPLDTWYYNLQGQGPGAVNPFAENAYSGLVGSLPAAIIWSSFHEGTSGFSVWQMMRLRVYAPVVRLHLHGDWNRIQTHFSAAAHGGGWFWSADVKAEFNSLRAGGAIQVTIELDETIPGADKIKEAIDKRSDLVFQKFMDQAQKVIFDPAPFSEKPAEASGGFLGLGGGGAVKLRRDTVNLTLDYDETSKFAYAQDYPISGQLTGLADVIAGDVETEKKYFSTLYLSDWDRKMTRVVTPVTNWPDASGQFGQGVAFMSVQIGYPNTAGVLQWDSHSFSASDGPSAQWTTATEMKKATDVAGAPAGWTPDKSFVRRTIHFQEPPSQLQNPHHVVSIERNVVELDPEGGTLTDVTQLEIRADSAGILEVGPIDLGGLLENASQVIEVTFTADGQTKDGGPRLPVTMVWKFEDQNEPRTWMIVTGDPAYAPSYSYQVHVLVKGTIFAKGAEWTGPVNKRTSNGPLTVIIPTQDEAVGPVRALDRFGRRTVGSSGTVAALGPSGRPPAGRSAEAARPKASTADADATLVSGWSASDRRPPRGTATSRNGPTGAAAHEEAGQDDTKPGGDDDESVDGVFEGFVRTRPTAAH